MTLYNKNSRLKLLSAFCEIRWIRLKYFSYFINQCSMYIENYDHNSKQLLELNLKIWFSCFLNFITWRNYDENRVIRIYSIYPCM